MKKICLTLSCILSILYLGLSQNAVEGLSTNTGVYGVSTSLSTSPNLYGGHFVGKGDNAKGVYAVTEGTGSSANAILAVGNGGFSYAGWFAGRVTVDGDFNVKDYTRLGDFSEGAPPIKTKLVTGTTSSSTSSIAHGMADQTKIISISVIVEDDFSGAPYYEHYTVNWHDPTNIALTESIPNGSNYKVYITYIE